MDQVIQGKQSIIQNRPDKNQDQKTYGSSRKKEHFTERMHGQNKNQMVLNFTRMARESLVTFNPLPICYGVLA